MEVVEVDTNKDSKKKAGPWVVVAVAAEKMAVAVWAEDVHGHEGGELKEPSMIHTATSCPSFHSHMVIL